MDYYISRLVRVIWLVHFAGYISLYGLLNAKVCFDCQNVSWRKIWNRPQENYTNEEILSNTVKRQNISGDSLKGFANSRLMEMLWTYLLHCVRIWCTSIINGHSARIVIFPASILTQRYNKHLANLVFLGRSVL